MADATTTATVNAFANSILTQANQQGLSIDVMTQACQQAIVTARGQKVLSPLPPTPPTSS